MTVQVQPLSSETLGPLTRPNETVISYNLTPVAGNAYCVPHGTEINDSGNVVICGDDLGTQNFGDYWCPEEFVVNLNDYCEPRLAVCDFGRPDDVVCGSILGSDDPLFNSYNSECVADTGNIGSYSEACCLEASFNGFEIYNQNINNVKVY